MNTKNENVTQDLHKVFATLDEMAAWSRNEGENFISEETIEVARNWFNMFYALVRETWHEPHVTTDVNGDRYLLAIWQQGKKTVKVYLDVDEIDYVRECGTEKGYEDSVDEQEWRRIWAWLYSPHRYAEGDRVYRRSHGPKRTGTIMRLYTSSPNRETYDVQFDGEYGPEIGRDRGLCHEPKAVVVEGQSYYPYVVVGIDNLALAT